MKTTSETRRIRAITDLNSKSAPGEREMPGTGVRSPSAAALDTAEPILRVFESALARLALVAAATFAAEHARPPTARQLVQLLRGTVRPAEGESPPLATVRGVFAAISPEWVERFVESLRAHGWLEELPQSRLILTTGGRALIEDPSIIASGLLPSTPCLGDNPREEERLWRVRRELAESHRVSAFCVFPNTVLAAIAAARPRDLGELAAVKGFGEGRVRRYGRAVLASVRDEGAGEGAKSTRRG